MRRRPQLAAVACLAAALACGRPASDLDLARAVNAMDDGRFDLARESFARHLESRPGDLDALRGAGRAWMKGALQSPGHARPYWQEVLAARPGDPEARLALANVQYLLGEHEAALSLLEGLPADGEAERLRARVLLEVDPEGLIRLAEQRVAAAGSGERLSLAAAQASELLGRDAETHRWARLAVEQEPLSASAHYLLSRSLRREGRLEEAERAASIHRSLRELAAPLGATRGTALERLRLIDDLAARLERPPDELTLMRLDVLAEAGLRVEARALLAEVIARDDRFAASRDRLAGWAERVGELKTAEALLEEELAATTTPESLRALRHRLARLRRATAPERAESLLRAALEEQPLVARHHCMLAEVLLERGRAAEACESFERALELAPWRADCRLSLARLRHVEGARERAAELLAAAPEPDPRLARFAEKFGYDVPGEAD